MINNSRSIENTWKMLQYLYDELASRKFKTLDITGIQDMDSLYALIISKWCASLATEGLHKEYVEIENEEMTSPRGQINIQETVARQSKLRGSIICSYDELSENITINQILKSTLQYLLTSDKIDKELKNELTKTLQLYNGIDYIDINDVHWKDIKFNNNNIRYKHLIEVCKTLLAEQKLKRNFELDDNKRLFILFKKHLFRWYKIMYGKDDTVLLFEKPFYYANESPLELSINKSQKIVAICTEKVALLICARLMDEQLLDNSTLVRKHKEVLVEHIRDFKKEHRLNTYGCIIYVNTDKTKINIQHVTVSNFHDFIIGEATIDIHDQWRFTEAKLKEIYKFFIQRFKANAMRSNKQQ